MRERLYLEQTVGVQRPAGHCGHLAPVGAVTRVGHPHIHHLNQEMVMVRNGHIMYSMMGYPASCLINLIRYNSVQII